MPAFKSRPSDFLPFFLLFPPVISLLEEVFGGPICGWPGLLEGKYVEWFRVPVFDHFLFGWATFEVPGIISDLITIYAILGSLNAKVINHTERMAAPSGSVGVMRIFKQLFKGNLKAALFHAKSEMKLIVLWPRTIKLMRTYYATKRPSTAHRPDRYFGDLIERMRSVALVAIVIVPLVSSILYYWGLHLC